MRRIVLLMHASLVGFAAGPHGEMDRSGFRTTFESTCKGITDQADSAL
jgi:hypothetical protein